MAKEPTTGKNLNEVGKPAEPLLHFDVSTGLKRVIGRELITDTEVAIFELVKNSFDANARNVKLYFDDDSIVISDDGDGMSYDDIINKWLFVAYSAKRSTSGDYREQISSRPLAGSKGVGRFSSDRLGRYLTLQSRPKGKAKEPVHQVVVDWESFEGDDTRNFTNVELAYVEKHNFDTPPEIPAFRHGTILQITKVHETWNRDRLKRLKRSLTKLINPFGTDADDFNLEIIAPLQVSADRIEINNAAKNDPDLPPPSSEVINGPVRNFIFSTLQEKTTFIDVALSNDGKFFETSLMDRGELVYRIRERNPYESLVSSHFRCQLYYLNRSAKSTFALRMGVPSVQFGSVFLFRNGFRVYPVGEDGTDWWRLARRKQQGYARFFGPREVMGRVDVTGGEKDFQEASSRNQALLNTPASLALKECFMEMCIKRLEAYVVPVSWVDKGEADTSDLSRLLTDEGRARVAASVSKLTGSSDIELLDYSKKLIQVINERAQNFETSLDSLRTIADKASDRELMDSVDRAERRFEELRKAEQQAQKRAEEERIAREKAEQRADGAKLETEIISEKYQEVVERNLFLTSVTSLDYDTVVNLHHQIILYASEIGALFENEIADWKGQETVRTEDILSAFEQAIFLNQKVLAVARFATRATFKLDSGEIEEDIVSFLVQYIDGIGQEYLANNIRIEIKNTANEFIRRFKPIEFSILVDNLVSNSRKQEASKIIFDLSQPNKDHLILSVSDDGPGFSHKIENIDDIFEKGYSQKDNGTGLGLYHVRQVLSGMGASITVDPDIDEGARFIVRFVK